MELPGGHIGMLAFRDCAQSWLARGMKRQRTGDAHRSVAENLQSVDALEISVQRPVRSKPPPPPCAPAKAKAKPPPPKAKAAGQNASQAKGAVRDATCEAPCSKPKGPAGSVNAASLIRDDALQRQRSCLKKVTASGAA